MKLMKKLYITLLIVVPIMLFSQIEESKHFEVSAGSVYEKVDLSKTSKFKIIRPEVKYYYLDDYIIMIKRLIEPQLYSLNQKIDLTVQIYSVDRKKEVKRFSHTHNNETDVLEDFLIFNSKFYLFFSRWDSKNNNEQLFVKELDYKNGNFSEERLLFKVNDKISRRGFEDIGKFFFYYSQDKQRLLVQYRKVSKIKSNKKNYDEIGLYVFEDDLNFSWNKEVTMPHTEKEMNVSNYFLDSKNRVLILAEINSKPKLLIYNPKKDINIIDIDIPKHTLAYPRLIEDTSGNIILVSGYCVSCEKHKTTNHSDDDTYKKIKRTEIDGVVLAHFNKESFSNFSYYSFPEDMVFTDETDKVLKGLEKARLNNKSIIPHAEIRDVYFNEDGNIVFFLEELFQETKSRPNNDIVKYFYSKAVYLITFTPDGEMIWVNKFSKFKLGNNFPEIKSILFSTEKEHYIINRNSDGAFLVFIIDNKTGLSKTEMIISNDNLSTINDLSTKVKTLEFPYYRYNHILRTKTGFVLETQYKNEEFVLHIDF